MHFFIKELLFSLTQPVFIFLTIVSAFLNAGGALAFFLIDGASHTPALSYFDSLFFAVTTTTGVGYGDITPHTVGGKIVAMSLMLMGTAVFAAFTGTLAATLLELELKRRQKF